MHWTEPTTADDSHAALEKKLWEAANQLWAGADLKPSEYSPNVLGLIFLRYADVHFSPVEKDLSEEEQRHLRENVSDEELAVFDILTRPGPDLSPQETEAIKKVCRDLLAKLKTEKLVLAWRERRTTRAAVRVEIEKMPDSGLPEKYTTELFESKCGALFQHMLEKYPESGTSVYSEVI